MPTEEVRSRTLFHVEVCLPQQCYYYNIINVISKLQLITTHISHDCNVYFSPIAIQPSLILLQEVTTSHCIMNET